MVRPVYNLARFDLTTVRLAVDCALSGNLTAAAKQSNLVLPAASRRIRELESALGEALFERSSRGMQCTAADKAFLRHGLAMLHQVESLGLELTDLREGVMHHLRLCASTAAINQFLPPLLARYAVLRPEMRIPRHGGHDSTLMADSVPS